MFNYFQIEGLTKYYQLFKIEKYQQSSKERFPGLQITVGHRPLADQNLLMSDEIRNVVGHDVRTNILS